MALRSLKNELGKIEESVNNNHELRRGEAHFLRKTK